jgi:hypothetical protein
MRLLCMPTIVLLWAWFCSCFVSGSRIARVVNDQTA